MRPERTQHGRVSEAGGCSATMVNQQQYRRLLSQYAKGRNMSQSALAAGIDRKTARKYIRSNQSPDELHRPSRRSHRPDPLIAIWPQARQMLGDSAGLEAKALFEYFLAKPESGLEARHLRTFQRRVSRWRATEGPEKEVYFPRKHTPGESMELDWTHADNLRVTIQGIPLKHMFCHCVLSYSNWQWARRCQSESFLSLVSGLQAAFGKLGRKPKYLGTDHSSAATHEIGGTSHLRSFNPDYLDLCEHYDLLPVTINIGCPHEHGDVESLNGHFKRQLEQHLLLRGSRDFECEAEYDRFVERVLELSNKRRSQRLAEELAGMGPLPPSRLEECQQIQCWVGPHSTIRVKKVAYSVPSRLIGQNLRVQIHESQLKVFLGADLVQEMPRARGDHGGVIDFRHVVGPMLRKPGAFARYKFREQLYPSVEYRAAYDRLVADHGSHGGTVEYLQLLRLAAERSPQELEPGIRERMSREGKWWVSDIRKQVVPQARAEVEEIALEPELRSYDALLGREEEVAHGF